MYQGKKALLVGGAGFIGHNLAIYLSARGCEVTIIDSFNLNNIASNMVHKELYDNFALYNSFLEERVELLKQNNVRLIIGDVTDSNLLTKAILSGGYTAVYMLSAVAHASRANQDPVLAWKSTLGPMETCISVLSEMPETRLVFMSSSTVYGHFKKETVDEEDTCRPFGVYATIKFALELMLKEIAEHSKLNYSVARPSALYGERCISRRVCQIFLENSYSGVTNIFRGDVDEKLDFTYIWDLCQGLALTGFHENASGQVFNLTAGDARKVLSAVDILKKYFPDANVTVEKRNQATPKRGTLSNFKAKSLLGFEPKYSFEDGYGEYIGWFIDHVERNNISLKSLHQNNE